MEFSQKINSKAGGFNDDNNITDAQGMSPAAQEASPKCSKGRKRSLNLRYEDVCKAASDVEKTGRAPTSYNVRNLLGRGSYTTILNMLRRRSAQGNCTQEPRSSVTEPHDKENQASMSILLCQASIVSVRAVTALLERNQSTGPATAPIEWEKELGQLKRELKEAQECLLRFYQKVLEDNTAIYDRIETLEEEIIKRACPKGG